eukprot:2653151-Amphidinium_carterae.2
MTGTCCPRKSMRPSLWQESAQEVATEGPLLHQIDEVYGDWNGVHESGNGTCVDHEFVDHGPVDRLGLNRCSVVCVDVHEPLDDVPFVRTPRVHAT